MTPNDLARISFAALLCSTAAVAIVPTAFAQDGISVAGQLRTVQANDLITGQNKPGPYTLAWNHFFHDLNHPISVVVDGLVAPQDSYTLDPVKGTIVFTTPLKSTSIARIGYLYDPASAQRNQDFTQAPVTVPLMHAAGTDFQLTALPESLSGGGSTKLVYGLNRQTNLLGGGLTSKALVADNGSSLNFGYKYGGDKNGFDAAYQKTERGFADHVGKSLNLGAALSTYAMGAHLRPTNYLGLAWTSNDKRDLVGGVDNTQHGLTLNLGGVKAQPTLNFSRLINVTDPGHNTDTDVTTDKLDLTSKLGGFGVLTAKGQRVATDAPGSASDTTARDASASYVTVSKDKKRQASVLLSDSTAQNVSTDTRNQDVQIKVQPVQILTLSAEQKDTKNTPIGATTGQTTDTQTSLTAEITPLVATKVSGAVRDDIQGDAHRSIKDLNAQVGTGKAIEVGGGITDRSVIDVPSSTPTLDSKRANVALRPFKAFTLTGGYTWNPEKDGVVTDAVRQDVGLNAHLGALDFGSVYSLTTLNGLNLADSSDPQFGQVSLTLGLRFSRFTTLKGNYQDFLLYGYNPADGAIGALPAKGARVYGLNLTHTLGPMMNISMNGTVTQNYAVVNATPDYKAQATLGAKF